MADMSRTPQSARSAAGICRSVQKHGRDRRLPICDAAAGPRSCVGLRLGREKAAKLTNSDAEEPLDTAGVLKLSLPGADGSAQGAANRGSPWRAICPSPEFPKATSSRRLPTTPKSLSISNDKRCIAVTVRGRAYRSAWVTGARNRMNCAQLKTVEGRR